MPHEIAGKQAVAITDGRTTKERVPSKVTIIVMDKRSIPTYSITSGKVKGTTADS